MIKEVFIVMKTKKKLVLLVLLVFVLFLFTACGTENPMKHIPLEETNRVYGFWNGLWDGFTAIFAFIVNIFGGHFGIYQVHNNGGLYDFGFLIGIGAFAGGGSSAASRKRH